MRRRKFSLLTLTMISGMAPLAIYWFGLFYWTKADVAALAKMGITHYSSHAAVGALECSCLLGEDFVALKLPALEQALQLRSVVENPPNTLPDLKRIILEVDASGPARIDLGPFSRLSGVTVSFAPGCKPETIINLPGSVQRLSIHNVHSQCACSMITKGQKLKSIFVGGELLTEEVVSSIVANASIEHVAIFVEQSLTGRSYAMLAGAAFIDEICLGAQTSTEELCSFLSRNRVWREIDADGICHGDQWIVALRAARNCRALNLGSYVDIPSYRSAISATPASLLSVDRARTGLQVLAIRGQTIDEEGVLALCESRPAICDISGCDVVGDLRPFLQMPELRLLVAVQTNFIHPLAPNDIPSSVAMVQ